MDAHNRSKRHPKALPISALLLKIPWQIYLEDPLTK